MNQPLLIELVGLPGAGKTTVEHKLIEELKQQNIKYIATPGLRKKCRQDIPSYKKFWEFSIILLKNFDLVIYLFIFALYIKPLNIESFRLVKQFFFTLQLINYKNKSMYDVMILDQGLINNIWSIIISGNSFNSKVLCTIIRKLIDRKAMERFIFMEIDVETAVERIENRVTTDSRFDRMDNESIKRVLYKSKGFMNEIIKLTSESEKVDILEINAEDEITYKIKYIADWIQEAIIKLDKHK